MTRAVTFTAAQVAALVEQGRQEAVKVSNEMHAELLAHLERVPANAIVLPQQVMDMHFSERDVTGILLSSSDETRTVVMYRYYSGMHAGSWLAEERVRVAGEAIWKRAWNAMRPDDFGTLFEVRP